MKLDDILGSVMDEEDAFDADIYIDVVWPAATAVQTVAQA